MKYIDFDSLFNKQSDGIEIKVPLNFEHDNCIITGSDIIKFDEYELEDKLYSYIQKRYGITFFSENHSPEINLYCVPYMQIFASDESGVFGLKFDFKDGDFYNSKIYYLTFDRKVFFISKDISTFVEQLKTNTFNKNILVLCDDIKLFSSYLDAIEELKKNPLM